MKVEYEHHDGGYTGMISQVEAPYAFVMISRQDLVEAICECIKDSKPKRVAIHIDGAAEPIYLHGNTVKSIIEGKRTASDFVIGAKTVEEE